MSSQGESSKRPRENDGRPPPLGKAVRLEKSDTNHSIIQNARIVVGVDFGTTFSGFGYALTREPEKVYTFYEWRSQTEAGAKSYCKTQTSLFYLPGKTTGSFELHSWGWPAYVNHNKALQAHNALAKSSIKDSSSARVDAAVSSSGRFLTKFKLLLVADGADFGPQALTLSERLPEGLSLERVIADFLRELSTFIVAELKNKFGSHIEKKDVQWCVTVPAIWNDRAKQTMASCCQMAGLVQGRYCQDEDASPHPIVLVLEPGAASAYCQTKLKDNHLRKGSKFLLVDAGGGTVDLVVHEKMDDSGVRVKEVARSTGDLCGGTFVDKAFMTYLAGKIDCFEKFCAEYPATVLTLKWHWENLKCSFYGQPDPYELQLPGKLATAWELHAKASGTWRVGSVYDEIMIHGRRHENDLRWSGEQNVDVDGRPASDSTGSGSDYGCGRVLQFAISHEENPRHVFFKSEGHY